jgi:hypothetical protein
MKRFWLVLLSLGLVMAFSVSAFAVDVKVAADYYVGGLYLNKITVDDGFQNGSGKTSSKNPSTAFFYQDLRVGADFIVSPSLKLVTQFDAMERIWGGQRSGVSVPDANGPGTRAEAENIALRQIHVDYVSPVGLFKVGYMEDYVFGTVFANRGSGPTTGQIQYYIQKGPFTGFIGYAKEADGSYDYNQSTTSTDKDFDSYRIAGIYNFKGGEAGALFMWERNSMLKASGAYSPNIYIPYEIYQGWMTTGAYLSNIYVIDPYVKVKLGPVDLQAELLYYFGDMYKWEDNSRGMQWYGAYSSNVGVDALSIFIDATASFSPIYVGGSFAYLSGDDLYPANSKIRGGFNTAGLDWNPCLILFNQDLNYWGGAMRGHSNTTFNTEMSNAWFGQLRVGVKPTPQLDAMLAVSYAQADKKPYAVYAYSPGSGPNGWIGSSWIDGYMTNGTYGTEIDITGTYKITNNLTYMLGFGYLFTGDYFKGIETGYGNGSKICDDFIVLNKLTLSF